MVEVDRRGSPFTDSRMLTTLTNCLFKTSNLGLPRRKYPGWNSKPVVSLWSNESEKYCHYNINEWYIPIILSWERGNRNLNFYAYMYLSFPSSLFTSSMTASQLMLRLSSSNTKGRFLVVDNVNATLTNKYKYNEIYILVNK